jgi:hypothetical protein
VLASAFLFTLTLIAALLLVPLSALASYYPGPELGDSYQRTTSYLAAYADAGTIMSPQGFTTAPDGTLWLVENDQNTAGVSKIVSYDEYGSVTHAFAVRDFSGSGGSEVDYRGLIGLTWGPDGQLYAASWIHQMVLAINPANGIVTAKIGNSSVFSNPRDLEFDRNGNLFVVDSSWPTEAPYAGRVVRYDSTLTTYTSFYGADSLDGVMIDGARGLSIDALNNVWIADYYNNRIVQFDNDGDFISAFTPMVDEETTLLDSPTDVYVDGYGSMYVIDELVMEENQSNRFVRLGPDGSFLGSYPGTSSATIISGPTNISVSSVVYGGDVFVDTYFPETLGIVGAVQRWDLVPAHPDTTTPVTQSDAPTGWQHTTSVTVSLTATDTGWGLQVTKCGYSPSTLTTYTAPMVVSAQGTTTIYYLSLIHISEPTRPY